MRGVLEQENPPLILIVEDDELSREILARRLRQDGYEVVYALNGKQGVEMAREQQPDLVIMDLGLPVMDGWEATKRIKSAPETSHIPVVALSAHVMGDDRRRALEAGCDTFEKKPLKFDELRETLHHLLLD